MPDPSTPFVPRDGCSLCGSRRFEEGPRLLYAPEDTRGFLSCEAQAKAQAIEFRLRSCRDCGFQWTSPQPIASLLRQLYAETSGGYFDPLAEASPDRQRVYGAVQALLRRHGVLGGRLLDVGCGTGEALRALRGAFEPFGVEPSRYAAARAKERAGAIVHVGDLASAGYPDGHFAAITAFDVIEHLAEPMPTLRELRRILQPGGTLVVETGDIGSLNARLAAGHWYYALLPGHLSFFSRRTLPAALATAGFTDLHTARTHHGPLTIPFMAGYVRALTRHLMIRLCGPNVLALPVFRSRTAVYRVPYFFDHMLVSARVRA